MREFLEENYTDGLNEEQAVLMAIKSLLEVVESERSMEVCIIKAKESTTMTEEQVGKIVSTLKAEKEATEAAKKAKKQAQTQ